MKNKFLNQLFSEICYVQQSVGGSNLSFNILFLFFAPLFLGVLPFVDDSGWNPCFSQDTWVQKADLPANGRTGAVGFSIGTKGYIGTGRSQTMFSYIEYSDFWEWDQATDVWTQKADFGGGGRYNAVGFSIGNKGYIGTGQDYLASTCQEDLWEWNQATNTWVQKANLPVSGGRMEAIGFSIGAKGYIGTGNPSTGPGIGQNFTLKDFWEWDQATDTWSQKTSFGGTSRTKAVGFSIGNKGYIGTGGTVYDNMGLLVGEQKDFWEWDQATDVWTQKASFSGAARLGAVGFSIGTKGYIGTGRKDGYSANPVFQDFWEWDQATNVWTQKAKVGSPARYGAVGFSIGCHGYVGTGNEFKQDFNSLEDFWEYTPDPLPPNCCAVSAVISASTDTICMGSSASILASGGTGYSWSTGATTASIIVAPSITTSYWVIVSDTAGNGCSDMAAVTIPVKNCCTVSPVISSDPSTTVCVGAQVFVSASGGTTYSWNTGAASANIVVTPTVTTTYSVTVTDASGCTGIGIITIPVDPGCTATSVDQVNDALHPVFIWPNPSAGEFWLSIPSGQITGYKLQITDLEIYNVMGEKITQLQLLPNGGGLNTNSLSLGGSGWVLDLSLQPNGVYFLHIRTGQGTATKKLIIHK